MLKSIAKVFELKEASISKSTLHRILVLMLLSLPTWPLVLADYYDLLPDNIFGTVAIIAKIVGTILLICVVCTRFVNRFYFPDKYLDEWEIRIKHKSMAFAFMFLLWAVVPPVLIFMAVKQYSLNMSGFAISLWLSGMLLILFYIQTFHALWQVRPIDDE